MTEERKQELTKKIQFVENIEKAIVGNICSIECVKYEVYEHISQNWVEERLVVTFKGGAISVRNCNATSCSGILKSLAKLVDGGYYDEVPYYEQLQTRSDFELLKL